MVQTGPFVTALSRPLDTSSVPTPAPVSRFARSRDATSSAVQSDDAALVAAALAGDRAAEESLYRRHAPSVLHLATRLLRSNQDASDVLQDAFVAAFDELGALRAHDAFRGWVHRITVRLVHRRFRRRRLLAFIGKGNDDDDVSLESLADESASAEARVELRWLDAALARLDERERVAWMLRHVEDLTLEEVAEACECSLATVKRRVAAAEVVVRRHLEGGPP